MEVVIMIFQVLLALSILIVLHEWGHYFTARMFGIKVEKFYLFFDAWGKKLFSFKKGDTEYGIGWLPLGGYVKISGMIDESMDKEQMKEEPKEWEFRTKPAWQRLIVMLGGIVVNLILGVLILWFMTAYYGDKTMPMDNVNNHLGVHVMKLGEQVGFEQDDKILTLNGEKLESWKEIREPNNLLADKVVYGIERNGVSMDLTMPEDFLDQLGSVGKEEGFLEYRMPFEIAVVSKGGNAEKSGLKVNDKIFSVNGVEVKDYHHFRSLMDTNLVMDLVVLRDGEKLDLQGSTDKFGMFGFQAGFSALEGMYKIKKYGFFESLPLGYHKGVETLVTQVKGFKKMIQGKINARKNLMGPIQLAKVFGGELIWERFWNLTALFSLVLAFMNLLPIPGLDGGHALFCIVEIVSGRTLSDKWMQYVQTVGMIILLALMVFIFGNDILRLMGI